MKPTLLTANSPKQEMTALNMAGKGCMKHYYQSKWAVRVPGSCLILSEMSPWTLPRRTDRPLVVGYSLNSRGKESNNNAHICKA